MCQKSSKSDQMYKVPILKDNNRKMGYISETPFEWERIVGEHTKPIVIYGMMRNFFFSVWGNINKKEYKKDVFSSISLNIVMISVI